MLVTCKHPPRLENRMNFNLLKPARTFMYQQVQHLKKFYLLITFSLCVFRTNSDLCHLQHKLIGFYNRDEKCLQRGTNWVFK